MNVLEQLQALGFREAPLQFYDGGDAGDPSGGAGEGPGGTDVSSEVSVDYGGTGPSIGDTVGQGAVSGPSGPYGGVNSINNAQVAAAVAPTIALANELATSPSQAYSLTIEALNDMGFGSVTGLNPNNPTQSVEEMQAAQNVAAAIPVALSFMPGAGLVKTAQTVGGLLSGQASIGQAVATLGLGVVANQLGVSPGMLNSLISGNLGQIVSNVTMAQAPAAVNAILGVTGLGSKIGSGIASTINEQLGITPIDTLGTIGRSIDQSFGLTPGTGGAPGFTHTGEFSLDGGQGAATGGGESGASERSSSGIDLSSLSPLLVAATLEDILKPQEEEKREKTKAIPVSPFGSMPYE